MNRTLPMCCLTILSILVLAWVLPLLYDTALLKSLDRTHYFYSPVLKKFIYTEQTHASDPQAAQKADGHHADIVYKDEDGNYHDRLAFEAALPFIYFRNMEMRGLLPLQLDGNTLQRADIERARRVLELPARHLDGKRPPRGYLPLIEARPGQVALLYPADRFCLTEKVMRFLNADTMRIDPELTRRFTAALREAGFSFPARHVGGNFTTFKPHEGGIYLVDQRNALFHLLRRNNRPQVRRVMLPQGVAPRHVLVSESRERIWGGMMLDWQNRIWLMREGKEESVPQLLPLSLPHYDPETMDCKLIFDPLYLTAIVSDESRLYASVYALPQGDDMPATLLPLRTAMHHMPRDKRIWTHHVGETLFPFRVVFSREDSALRTPEILPSPGWLSGAFPLCLLLGAGYAARLYRRRELTGGRWLETGLVAAAGIYALIPLLLLDERS